MSSDILSEEFEVLESIYSTELSKISESDIHIDVEPDDLVDGVDSLVLRLAVHYPGEYPDVLPELTLDAIEGELTEQEIPKLLTDLHVVGEENLGMAMTFTLVSHLRELLSSLVRSRAEDVRKADAEKERLALEAEEAHTRGTPVTVDSFNAWKVGFDREQAMKKTRDEDEKMKGLTPKEREEFKKIGTRMTGRQLFERNKSLEDEPEVEDGAVSVDVGQYEKTRGDVADEDADGITFSDSD